MYIHVRVVKLQDQSASKAPEVPARHKEQAAPFPKRYGAARLVPLPILVGFEREIGPDWLHVKSTFMFETSVHGVQLTQGEECRLGTPEIKIKNPLGTQDAVRL